MQDVCTIALNLFRQIAIYLAPVLPDLAERTGELLNDPIKSWDQAQTPLVGTPVAKFKHMIQKVEAEKVHKMIEESKEELAASATTGQPEASAPGPADESDTVEQFIDQWQDSGDALEAEPLANECTFDDFLKVDLRVARVVEAEQVPEARKLLRLKLSLGGGVYKQVFAGIKAAYDPGETAGPQDCLRGEPSAAEDEVRLERRHGGRQRPRRRGGVRPLARRRGESRPAGALASGGVSPIRNSEMRRFPGHGSPWRWVRSCRPRVVACAGRADHAPTRPKRDDSATMPRLWLACPLPFGFL